MLNQFGVAGAVFVWYRYTSLVDPYIPCISVCLRDQSVLIRRHALTLLTRLLQVYSVHSLLF